MKELIPWLILVIPLIIGFFALLLDLYEKKSKLQLTVEYRNDFVTYINELLTNKRIDNTKYIKLTESVNEMQKELGYDGVLYFHDPLSGLATNNYQVLINFLPKTREFLRESDNIIALERFNQECLMCEDAMIRHKGTLDTEIKNIKRKIINPFVVFAYGIRCIITIPIRLLYWFGLLSDDTNNKVYNSFLVRVISAVIAIVGLLADIITIAIGWETFTNLLKSIGL